MTVESSVVRFFMFKIVFFPFFLAVIYQLYYSLARTVTTFVSLPVACFFFSINYYSYLYYFLSSTFFEINLLFLF